MKFPTLVLATLILAPFSVWGSDSNYDDIADRMDQHQRDAERMDGRVSSRLQELASERASIQDKAVRDCMNIAHDLHAAARKRVSDGLQVRVAMASDERRLEELREYRYVASQIFYAASRDMESVLSRLDSCVASSNGRSSE